MTRILASVISCVLWLAPVLNAHAACCAGESAPVEQAKVELSPCGHEIASTAHDAEPLVDSPCGQGLDCCGISLGLQAGISPLDFVATTQTRLNLILLSRTDPPLSGLLRPPSLS